MGRRARVIVLESGSGICAIHETEIEDPAPGQVLVEILAAGVGYPELHKMVAPQTRPLLLGTEAFGRVRIVGDGVSRVKPGDYVVLAALHNHDEGNDLTFSFEPDDGEAPVASALFTFATDVLVDARYCHAIPAVPDREAAAILGTTAAAGAGAVLASGLGKGQSVAVFGAAGVGLMAVATAAAAGANPIIVIDRTEARLALATKLGATHTINGTTEQALSRLAEISPGGVDFTFDSVYEYRTKNRPGQRSLASGGMAYLLGAPGTDAEGEAFAATRVSGGYQPLPEAGVDVLIASLGQRTADRSLNPTAVVTNRYTIEGVNEALRDLENGDVVGQAIIVMEPLEFA